MNKKILTLLLISFFSNANENTIKENGYTEQEEKEHQELVKELVKSGKLQKEEENIVILESREIESTEENWFKGLTVNENSLRLFNTRGLKENVFISDLREMEEDSGNYFCGKTSCFKQANGFWDLSDNYYLFNEEFAYKIENIKLKENIPDNKDLRVRYFEKTEENKYKQKFISEMAYFSSNFTDINFGYNKKIYNNIIRNYITTNIGNKKIFFKKNEKKYINENNDYIELNNSINKIKYKNCEIYMDNKVDKKKELYQEYNFPFSEQVISYNNESITPCKQLKSSKNKILIYKENPITSKMIIEFKDELIIESFTER
tara:strand:- start:65165 stop:66121 length:957 start_codon:yes stop_codon:yes gene_type:complete